MSPEANKAIVRRLWEDVWNRRNADVCDEIFDAAYAAHEKRFMPRMLAAFPDLRFEVEDMIAEGDKVVTRYALIATHRGEFMGIPATGKPVHLAAIWIHRLENGRIVEGQRWGAWDRLALLEQLGVYPPANRRSD
ncbi:MAG: ester cyclase [Anaerolineae bacterium]|nr:ester cyclase [Anaerolineae bacterium]